MGERGRTLLSFWSLGLLNNSAYVIMLASANNISAGSVGVVYLCAIVPCLCIKVSCPYWFHRVGYQTRIWVTALLMLTAYVCVAFGTSKSWQLLGVSLGSAQAGLGEATCLALCALYEPQTAITAWSSGTGFAGVFGYAFFTIVHLWSGVSFRGTVLTATTSCIAWLAVYHLLLQQPQPHASAAYQRIADSSALQPDPWPPDPEAADTLLNGPSRTSEADSAEEGKAKHAVLTWEHRLKLTCGLWVYAAPLATVYAAEYSMQSGTWTAIGFPITDAGARHRFYEYSNWAYQAGVFISRSSGMLLSVDRQMLWAMPAVQCVLLAFFGVVAVFQVPTFLYNYWLLGPAFVVGLLGGAVYVSAFILISKEVEPARREFSLAATSVAESMGTAVADVAGIIIQGCTFRVHGIPGADFACGAKP